MCIVYKPIIGCQLNTIKSLSYTYILADEGWRAELGAAMLVKQ